MLELQITEVINLKISAVSKKFGLPVATLRYYEEMKLIPAVSRNSSGYREYDDIDLKWINFVKCLRETGISIEILRNYVILAEQGEQTEQERKQILIDQQHILEEKMKVIQNTYDYLSEKISTYDQHTEQVRKIIKK